MVYYILKLLFLSVAIFFTLVNTAKVLGKNAIPAINFVYQTIGIVGFIALQFSL